jgi:hypothetical protein
MIRMTTGLRALILSYRALWYMAYPFLITFWWNYAVNDFGRGYGSGTFYNMPAMFLVVGFFTSMVCVAGLLVRIGWKKMPFYWIDAMFFFTGILLTLLTFQTRAFDWYLD